MFLDIQALASYRDSEAFAKKYRFGENYKGLRLAGLKLVGDGSPQGKTAFFKKPYLTQVPGCSQDCRGFPNIHQGQLNHLVQFCYQNKVQLYAHANGDASIDMLLAAHQKVMDTLNLKIHNQRTVVIHSQFVRPDQLDKYKTYSFVPSFFTNHAFFWGDVHLQNLGEERANFLSPMKTAKAKGIIATNHTDYIITPLNQLFLTWSAVNRTSRSGKTIGASERLTPYEALQAITINAAYQHRLEKTRGSIMVGKLADLIILDRNPLEVDPDEIKGIQVLETIKKGVIVFAK